jgi:hypothetical protein
MAKEFDPEKFCREYIDEWMTRLHLTMWQPRLQIVFVDHEHIEVPKKGNCSAALDFNVKHLCATITIATRRSEQALKCAIREEILHLLTCSLIDTVNKVMDELPATAWNFLREEMDTRDENIVGILGDCITQLLGEKNEFSEGT